MESLERIAMSTFPRSKRRIRNWARHARKTWWPDEQCVVFGNGRFAAASGCRPGHVILWCSETLDEAQDGLAHINGHGCGGRCRPWNQWHKCVDLMAEPEAWPPRGMVTPLGVMIRDDKCTERT
jgi:hypothetical protein